MGDKPGPDRPARVRAADIPAEALDDDRSWQGDHDPYLATLARQGREQRRAAGPPPHNRREMEQERDPYLVGLVRSCRSGSRR